MNSIEMTDSQKREIDGLNAYLSIGNGIGKLNSAATIYEGHVGYFYVDTIRTQNGTKQEAIVFSCTLNEGAISSSHKIVVTELPGHKKRLDYLPNGQTIQDKDFLERLFNHYFIDETWPLLGHIVGVEVTHEKLGFGCIVELKNTYQCVVKIHQEKRKRVVPIDHILNGEKGWCINRVQLANSLACFEMKVAVLHREYLHLSSNNARESIVREMIELARGVHLSDIAELRKKWSQYLSFEDDGDLTRLQF